ncbi:bucentaur or craniofacial development-domain-containing protein [Lipomyces arxii]|uniref:bucentaur or craniofacial development-domain-containing protein n=1 Tax=Lipomyces arxii TaxID=56418 RepID=UPI0034CFB583
MADDPASDEDDYRESEDEDFDPNATNADNVLSSDDENDGQPDDVDNVGIVIKKRKAGADSDMGTKKSRSSEQNEEPVEGIRILTRAQRSAEDAQEKREKLNTKSVIDTDAIWASMRAGASSVSESATPVDESTPGTLAGDDDMVTITETYEFAKEVVTRQKRVPKDSEEAKAYLRQQTDASHALKEGVNSVTGLKAKGKAPRRRKGSSLEAMANKGKPAKLNTLEKSKLDWQGFVENEGIEGDLRQHNKGGYLHKQDFLARVDQKRHADLKDGQKASKK